MSSSSTTGSAGERKSSRTRSPCRPRSDSQPFGRPVVVDDERDLQVGVGQLGLDLGDRLADPHDRRLPEVDVAHPLQREPLERAVGADEVLHERRRRVHQQLGRRGVLGEDPALLEDRDPVAHLDRLVDVVGDEDDRLAQLGLEAQELVLQPLAVDRVDRAERLVHQHQRRVGRERAGDADALALAAGQLGRDSGRGSRRAGRRSPAAPRRARSCAACPSRAGGARSRCSRRSSCAGTGRSAGSRSRSRAAARTGLRSRTLLPPIRMSPSVMSIIRLTIRIAVVLPQPEGPTSTQISPAGTSSESLSTAGFSAPG